MRFLTLAFFSISTAIAGGLEVSTIFSDHMVLQQAAPIKVWGRADPGAIVEAEFANQSERAITDVNGNWTLELEPVEASFEGRPLSVSCGSSELVFRDVLVGEVWLASGQSNMEWSVERSIDGDILVLGANDPYLRLHRVDHATTAKPRFTGRNHWKLDSAESAAQFSAVGYQFGRDMRKTLGVPVGIIGASVGGSPCIAWMRKEAFSKLPELMERNDYWEAYWEANLERYDEDYAAWKSEYENWQLKNGITEGGYWDHRLLGGPERPEDPQSPKRPARLANGMITPIAGYALRGVIWYQGEQDTGWRPQSYDKRLAVMVEDWRQRWGIDDLPFGIVQLAKLTAPQKRPANPSWAKVREGQRRLAASDPNVGMALALDVGEANDIHPLDKFTVARRLARWALAEIYEELDLAGGPEVKRAVRKNSAILLEFTNTGRGLHAMDSDELGGFSASDSLNDAEQGTDFYLVEASIASETEVILEIPEGRNPLRVRYAWQNNPANANLSNKERLPASPFEIRVSEKLRQISD